MDQNTYICYGKLVDTKKILKEAPFLIVVEVICVSNLLYTLFLFPFNYAFFYSSSSCYDKEHVVFCIKMTAR